MTTCGCGYQKTDKNGKPFIGISFDKALLPFTITDEKRFSLRRNENKKDPESKQPDFLLDVYIPKPPKDEETQEDNEDISFL